MNGLFVKPLSLLRIELMARLVTTSYSNDDGKSIVISWPSELTSDLVTKLNEYGVGQDKSTH